MKRTRALLHSKNSLYLEVAIGQGVYTWNDYNSNGIPRITRIWDRAIYWSSKIHSGILPNRVFVKRIKPNFLNLNFKPNSMAEWKWF
jgi:hypothetical protein